MRAVVPSGALVVAAVFMAISSCTSSGSPGSAAASGSVVTVSSPAAGSSSASALQASSPPPACPPVAGWPSGSRSPAPAGQLFVAGTPTAATLCQYVLFNADGSSPAPPVLARISGLVLTQLIASLNALVPTKDEPPCPAPVRSDVLVFAGAASPSIVRVELEGGCQFVWSDTGVHAYATDRLLQQLAGIAANAARSASSAATITVRPATGLANGQTVQVTVTGFHREAKVWLSECATAADVDPFGCGTGLPELPFLITNDTGRATGSFTVTTDIPSPAEDGTTQPCARCVLAAVSGDVPGGPPAPTASTPLTFGPTNAASASVQDVVPPVGSRALATLQPGVTVGCPDLVQGGPGAIGFRGDISAQPPSRSTVFRAVVRCELVTRDYAGLGSWQVELAEVAYGNPTDLIAQLRTPDQPATTACGMASQYGYPWFSLVEAGWSRRPSRDAGARMRPDAIRYRRAQPTAVQRR